MQRLQGNGDRLKPYQADTILDEELAERDLDFDLVQKVRQTWQFYRDRRPDMYGDLTRP